MHLKIGAFLYKKVQQFVRAENNKNNRRHNVDFAEHISDRTFPDKTAEGNKNGVA